MFPLICHGRIIAFTTRLLFQFAFVDFVDGCFGQTQQSAASSSKQAGGSGEWKVNHLTRAAEEEDYDVHPTYLSLSFCITCNLKKKKSSFKLFIYFFSIKEVKSIFFFSCSFLENPLVDCSECCHSASVQTERFWNAHRRVGNNGDANEKTFHTPQRLRGQWRGR